MGNKPTLFSLVSSNTHLDDREQAIFNFLKEIKDKSWNIDLHDEYEIVLYTTDCKKFFTIEVEYMTVVRCRGRKGREENSFSSLEELKRLVA